MKLTQNEQKALEFALSFRAQNSAWKRGVITYAREIVNENTLDEIERVGVRSWSNGGCALVYDEDIARRLCSPSELKRSKFGELPPNSHESWLDVQERALRQAVNAVKWCYRFTPEFMPLCDGTHNYHHTAYAKDYFPAHFWELEKYEGRCGVGYRLHVHAPNTTRYHLVMYYIQNGE